MALFYRLLALSGQLIINLQINRLLIVHGSWLMVQGSMAYGQGMLAWPQAQGRAPKSSQLIATRWTLNDHPW